MKGSDMKITEGYMPFMGYKTYYRIAGESTDKPPILLLHGGPGSTHNYMELLDPIAQTGRQVISYDQIGCGNSFVDGHPELWKAQTWIEELKTLRAYLHLDRLHLLGQSWGGMLEIQYLITCSQDGIQSAVLSSTLPASWLWAKEQHRMIRYMSPEDQAAIADAEQRNDYSGEAYQQANARYMQLHCAGPYVKGRDPECLTRPKKSGEESYLTAWGPNEYTPLGTLRDFDFIDRLGEIHVPTLVVSGTDDLCTPLVAKTMYDAIPGARWELFPDCRHMCYADDTPRYLHMLTKWLEEHDCAAH
jgi:proline iminopeptidase